MRRPVSFAGGLFSATGSVLEDVAPEGEFEPLASVDLEDESVLHAATPVRAAAAPVTMRLRRLKVMAHRIKIFRIFVLPKLNRVPLCVISHVQCVELGPPLGGNDFPNSLRKNAIRICCWLQQHKTSADFQPSRHFEGVK